MNTKKQWINLSLICLCIVATLGVLLRSKAVFALPFIDYNFLLNAHSHFAFGAWVTLAFMVLMVYDILPPIMSQNPAYRKLFIGIVLTSFGMLLTFPFEGYGPASISFSTLYIFVTYAFGRRFIRDIRKAKIGKTVRLLSVSALLCLALSSIGPFTLAYMLASKAFHPFIYRDAVFTYLHLSYNGFFTLSVFALLFHKIEPKITAEAQQNVYRFSVLLCISIIPSLFLSYLWQDPEIVLRVFAIIGSITVLLSFTWFIISALSIKNLLNFTGRLVRSMMLLSMISFGVKLFLQCLTIFPDIGNKVFGDRPIVIGYLHLVFLGFVSLFLLAYLAQTGLLNLKNKFTGAALIVFSVGVVISEGILMGQGLGAMFVKSSMMFPWLLWAASIWMLIAVLLVAFASRTKTIQ